MRVHKFTMSVSSLAIAAFDSGGSKWKLDADGKIAVDANGDPVLIQSDGKEMTVQTTTISARNGEAKTNRERAEKAEADLKKFEGIDPVKAREAMETVSKIDAKTLIDAGKVDEVKALITQQYQKEIDERESKISTMGSELDQMRLSRAFGDSKFVNERIAVPREMFEKTFADHFKIEDGKVVPYGKDGNKIMSPSRFGEVANVDEAFEHLVSQYPHKDSILKAPDASGTGNTGAGGGAGGGRRITRAEFDALPPPQQAAAGQQQAKGELTITD